MRTVQFPPEQLAEVRRLQALYPDRRGALLPVLHMAQDAFGWVSLEVEEYVAGLFDLSPAHVHEVVTFYTLYFRQPKGRHVVSVCHNLSCHLAGAKTVLAQLRTRLRGKGGESRGRSRRGSRPRPSAASGARASPPGPSGRSSRRGTRGPGTS